MVEIKKFVLLNYTFSGSILNFVKFLLRTDLVFNPPGASNWRLKFLITLKFVYVHVYG